MLALGVFRSTGSSKHNIPISINYSFISASISFDLALEIPNASRSRSNRRRARSVKVLPVRISLNVSRYSFSLSFREGVMLCSIALALSSVIPNFFRFRSKYLRSSSVIASLSSKQNRISSLYFPHFLIAYWIFLWLEWWCCFLFSSFCSCII